MNDQVFRYLSDTYHDVSTFASKMMGMRLNDPPRPTRYVLITEWFYYSGPDNAPLPRAQWSFNEMGSASMQARFVLPDKGEHNERRGNNYLFFDGHAVYRDLGQLDDKSNYTFTPSAASEL